MPTEYGWPGLSQWLWWCQHNKLTSHDRIQTSPIIFLGGKLTQAIGGVNTPKRRGGLDPGDHKDTLFQEIAHWQEPVAEYLSSKIPGAIVYHGRDLERHREDPVNGFGWVSRNLLASQIYALLITDPDNMPGPGVAGELSMARQAGLLPFIIFENRAMRKVAKDYVGGRFIHKAADQLPYLEKDVPRTFWMPSLDAFIDSIKRVYASQIIPPSNHVNLPSYPVEVVARHATIEMAHSTRSQELAAFSSMIHDSVKESRHPKLFPMSL